MKKLILLTTLALLLQGCMAGYIDNIPRGEFDEFTYDRGGNVSSVHITATNARKTKNTVKIENINISADYGPIVNFKIHLKGYKRNREKKEIDDKP